MIDLISGYIVGVGILHGVHPLMGWLLGVYYALQNRSLKDLYLAQLAVTAGHISSILLTLGPLYYLFINSNIPLWLTGAFLLAYAAYRILKKRRHPFLGLKFGLKRLSAISFLLAFQHAGTLSLIPILCLSPTLNPHRLGLLEILIVHGFGVITGIYFVSTLVYMLGVGVLSKIWVNFDFLWIGALLIVGFSALLSPVFMQLLFSS
jgi:hypothetical protein